MEDIAYRFKIKVKAPDQKQTEETMIVSETDSKLGESIALGKVVRYYENLREEKKILEYRIMA